MDGIVTAPNMLDVSLPAAGRFEHKLPPSHNAFAYVLQGGALFGTPRTAVGSQQIAVLRAGRLRRGRRPSAVRASFCCPGSPSASRWPGAAHS